ncbi:inosine/xanthosine triphosphatase [Candidatus Parvarchaeota archaeon]|nr:inosine/xanthosine triphosphatase [Candidatus Parvarchaeota archaeon]
MAIKTNAKIVIVGGTFDCFHAGHARLLGVAAKAGFVQIGITSDRFARSLKRHALEPYSVRAKAVERFMQSTVSWSGARSGLGAGFEISKIDDRFGGAASERAAKIICVSLETLHGAIAINRARHRRGLKPLKIICISLLNAQDHVRISSTRVRIKAIDKSGKRLLPVLLCVGSTNPSKLSGAAQASRRLFGKSFRVVGFKAKSGIGKQPFGQTTVKGAKNRALAAYKHCLAKRGRCDFGVGFESGLFSVAGRHYDVLYCSIYEPSFGHSIGCSMGFEVGREIVKKIKSEKSSLGWAVSKISGIRDIGRKNGAIHYLSGGLLKREEMAVQAMLCAMVPRIGGQSTCCLTRAKAPEKNAKQAVGDCQHTA